MMIMWYIQCHVKYRWSIDILVCDDTHSYWPCHNYIGEYKYMYYQLSSTSGWGRNIFFYLKPPRPGNEPRTLAWKAAVLTTTLAPPRRMSEALIKRSSKQSLPKRPSQHRTFRPNIRDVGYIDLTFRQHQMFSTKDVGHLIDWNILLLIKAYQH